MGKRGKKCVVSFEERIEEIRRHDIFDVDGKLKKERDPVWQVICDNIEQRDSEKKINVRNLYRYVTLNLQEVLIQLNIAQDLTTVATKPTIHPLKPDERDEEAMLLKMRKNVFYTPVMREFCTSPLTVFHWTIEAIDVSKDLTSDITYIFSLIGSFCKPFMAPDGFVSDKTISLYALGTEMSNEFVPLCQMSTEDSSVSLFSRFFSECIRSGLKVPNYLMLDYYRNHYITANEVFNLYMSYEDYLVMCYNYLSKEVLELPRVIINTNISLLLIKMKHWKSMCTVQPPSVTKFTYYSIIVLSLQENLDDFQQILQSIFVLFYSEFKTTITHQHFNLIMLKIKDLDVQRIYNIEDMTAVENKFKQILDSESISKIDYDKCKCIKDFIENVFIKANQNINQNDQPSERNAYYNPQFCKELMELCMEFVIWSNVMQQNSNIKNTIRDFTTLSDAYKNDFGDFLSLKYKSIPRVHEYLLKNIDYEYKKLEKVRNSINTNVIAKKKHNHLEYSYMQHEENWMGLNNDRVKINNKNESDSENSSNSDSDSDNSKQDFVSDSDIDFEEENLNISTFIDSICKDDNNTHILQTDNATSKSKLLIKYDQNDAEDVCAQDNGNLKESNVVNSSIYASNEQYENTTIDSMTSEQYENTTINSMDEQYKNTTLDNNKIEARKTKLKTEKKITVQRGKFLRPCDDIHLLQQKPTKNTGRKRKLIQNSNKFASKKINKERKILATSSHYDSIIEILTSAYYNIQKFQDFIDKSANVAMEEIKREFFNSLQQYVQNFNSRELNLSRIKLLEKLCNSVHTKFCWTKSMGEFLNRIMPSTIIEKFECEQCSFIIYQHSNLIKMSNTEIISDDLLENIMKHLYVPESCEKCGHQIFIADIYINNIISIDIEDMQKNTTSCLVKLNKLITNISIQKQTFILIGIVGFEEPIGDNVSRHYVAYCKSIQGSWMKYDDTEDSTKPVKLTDQTITINGAILIYIEYSDGA